MALTAGSNLGPYEIQSYLGAGGMGEVYHARDTRLERSVAIKILRAHVSEDSEAKQRFDREARAISSLSHPNICSLYDVGTQDNVSYIVMEYLRGETLADRLEKGPLPLLQLLKCAIDICDGLATAHRGGVIHRDLKPGNIMLTKSGAKLMDFGLAKSMEVVTPAGHGATTIASTPISGAPLTAQGTVVGTFRYMSPEQIEGHEADVRNDAKETAAAYQTLAALREVEVGSRERARTDAEDAVKLAPNRDVRAVAALVLARGGDTAAAEKLVAELDRTFPLDTLVQSYWLPTIRAAVALQRKDPNQAVELLKMASPIELSQPTNLTVFLCPVYLRGDAYLMLHDGSAAATEFHKFIDHYGLVVNFPWGALARLGLARAYALDATKDTAARDKARTAYQDFLTLWKDADPDIPIYKQAQAEYAKLR